MYGFVFLSRVDPNDRQALGDTISRIMEIERDRYPELQLRATLGPSIDGRCVEIALFRDKAASDAFFERVEREDPELVGLWDRESDLYVPDSVEQLVFLDDGFIAGSYVLTTFEELVVADPPRREG